MSLKERSSFVLGRLNEVCQHCEKIGCCPKCFSNMFQEMLVEFRNDEVKFPLILDLAEHQVTKYLNSISNVQQPSKN